MPILKPYLWSIAIIPLSIDEKISRIISQNRHDYPNIYDQLQMIRPEQAALAERQRLDLLHAVTASGAVNACRGTKPYTHQLSPGCRLCIEGSWSCLFINGRCNCKCFYCPSSQDDIGEPTTNNLSFSTPVTYLEYLKHFDFRGFSLSGGEPLLTLERSLNYLRTIKKHLGDKIHSWVYTNGSLVTYDILARLRDCGLDEIRFDIGARNYALDKAIMAVGIIPIVTVEIPAVPEEKAGLKGKLKQMADAGINFLNLHQLRLTDYNYPHFKKRPYTYLHGEKITVLESELTALELIKYAQDEQLELPINYCSFTYKNRYQQAAARARGAIDMSRGHEQVTAAGYLRNCSVKAEPERLQVVAGQLKHTDANHWTQAPAGNQLYFAASLWHHLNTGDLPVRIDYAQTRVSATLSYHLPFREIKLSGGRNIVIERSQAASFALTSKQAQFFFSRLAMADAEANDLFHSELPPELFLYEDIAYGLQPYF